MKITDRFGNKLEIGDLIISCDKWGYQNISKIKGFTKNSILTEHYKDYGKPRFIPLHRAIWSVVKLNMI